jgi:hypothetical protein
MFQTNVLEKIKIQILYPIIFFFENCAFYETMWKKVEEPGRPQMTIWRLHIACWIPKATDTHSEYAIITTFPLQQLLHFRLHVTFIIPTLSLLFLLTPHSSNVKFSIPPILVY